MQSRPRHATAAQTTFLFDRSQAQQLLELAAELPDNNHGRHRGEIYFMVFALMYGLGLRVGEATRLCRQDVDLERKVLVIRETKFLKSRLVPFGPKIEARLREYLQREGALGSDDTFVLICARPIQADYHHHRDPDLPRARGPGWG